MLLLGQWSHVGREKWLCWGIDGNVSYDCSLTAGDWICLSLMLVDCCVAGWAHLFQMWERLIRQQSYLLPAPSLPPLRS